MGMSYADTRYASVTQKAGSSSHSSSSGSQQQCSNAYIYIREEPAADTSIRMSRRLVLRFCRLYVVVTRTLIDMQSQLGKKALVALIRCKLASK
jgi:hypothetical protein